MEKSMAHEFEFAFTDREQFYAIVRLLNQECGKGNWTIKGKVLKGLKRIETAPQFYINHKASVKKTVVVPADKCYVEAMIRFVHTKESVN
jgi:predicted ribonuclease toxin of YeeF-YezG toxin-antitoxin module